ncbi:MAG: hypothetical protein RIC14_16615 [Filomicrobium sp.]
MNTPDKPSAVYAAGLVFAPSEEFPGSELPARRTKQTRRSKAAPPSAYDAQFIQASTKSDNTQTSWRSMFDVSWLLGRAPA